MSKRYYRPCVVSLLASLAFVCACSDDETPLAPQGDNTPTGNLPPIPVPTSPTDLLPSQSESRLVGLSNAMDDFRPMVSELCVMQDDGSEVWLPMNRRLTLVCAGVLPRNTSDPDSANGEYVSGRPRLMHTRHWRKVKQVTLEPGSDYSQQETVTFGTSTTHSESYEFSQTVGVEVSVGGGWGPFEASVTASFEQTTTHGEVNSVTFEEEDSITETYSVGAGSDTRVYALWQLVDEFALVDADTTQVHESDTMVHARIPEIASILFPNRDVIYQSVTSFR